ncbi:uncharacterized protein LOC119773143 [Cyprinodon tularosa]|uniref:uncharacterized protein LOC119773143 n=1 Tax=Cyprinodon tularosa TaxID=77115 RepID=UPI0018E26F2A|nr:uncharacterized protein LOC119773143 [Cyprinodon tularosa]
MKRKRDIASFFTTVGKEKCREREDEDNRAEEQDEREKEEMVSEEADKSETEAFNPESEEDDVGCEGESEEKKGQPVDPPSHLSSSQPSDISKCKDDQPVQPNLKMFPTTVMADRRRSFQASWYESHPWVEYSAIMDSAYCYACRHFSPPNISGSVFDSPSGFRNWKKATAREGGFSRGLRNDQEGQPHESLPVGHLAAQQRSGSYQTMKRCVYWTNR